MLQEPLQPKYSQRFFAGQPSAALAVRDTTAKDAEHHQLDSNAVSQVCKEPLLRKAKYSHIISSAECQTRSSSPSDTRPDCLKSGLLGHASWAGTSIYVHSAENLAGIYSPTS